DYVVVVPVLYLLDAAAAILEAGAVILASDASGERVPLEGIRRHAVVVPADIRGLVGVAVEIEEGLLEELHARVELAEHGVAALIGLEEQGSTAVRRRVERLGRVEDTPYREAIEQPAGLVGEGAASCQGLASRAD